MGPYYNTTSRSLTSHSQCTVYTTLHIYGNSSAYNTENSRDQLNYNICIKFCICESPARIRHAWRPRPFVRGDQSRRRFQLLPLGRGGGSNVSGAVDTNDLLDLLRACWRQLLSLEEIRANNVLRVQLVEVVALGEVHVERLLDRGR